MPAETGDWPLLWSLYYLSLKQYTGFVSGTAKPSRIFTLQQEGVLILWSPLLPALLVSVSINKEVSVTGRPKKEVCNSPPSEVSAKKTPTHSQALHVHSSASLERPHTSARKTLKAGDGSVPGDKSFRVSVENFSQFTWLPPPTCHKPVMSCKCSECKGPLGSTWPCRRQKQQSGEGGRREKQVLFSGWCSPEDTWREAPERSLEGHGGDGGNFLD